MGSTTGTWILGTAVAAAAAGAAALIHRGTRWGSTPGERAMELPGDDYFVGESPHRVVMTRAITVARAPDEVWPWLAQVGRGAGFHSIDLLDNGGRRSADHVVTWIPEPALGDATAIGYLRRIEPNVGLTWWLPGDRFAGAWVRLVTDVHLEPAAAGSRVVIRISGDAAGPTAPAVQVLFRAMDSIMATRQLINLKERIEASPRHGVDAETGERDQYQHYEVLYAGGARAGTPGAEKGARWRRAAIEAGVIVPAGTAS